MPSPFSPCELRAFRVVFHNGPVNHDATQRKFWNNWRVIEQYLTAEERSRLMTAHSHATFVGEGRGEWDGWCRKVAARLGGLDDLFGKKNTRMGRKTRR